MAKKAEEEQVFFCQCVACDTQGPARHTPLKALDAARRLGWNCQADAVHCPPCAWRAQRLEAVFGLPAAERK